MQKISLEINGVIKKQLANEISTISEMFVLTEYKIPIYDAIYGLLFSVNEYLNLARPMNKAQLQTVANFVIAKFADLTLEDVSVFCDKFKLGEYGSLYESLSGDKILSCLSEYRKEKNVILLPFKQKALDLYWQLWQKKVIAKQDTWEKKEHYERQINALLAENPYLDKDDAFTGFGVPNRNDATDYLK